MCGIVGFVGSGHSGAASAMNARQRHRGPDDEGIIHDPKHELSLAMSRLSIIDISDGHQPMEDVFGNFVIVYNGEIFNAPELRAELEAQGYRFRTNHSDTEVILQLYARDGEDCVRLLNGMFAFALYDRLRSKLLLARDAFGIKPLFFWKKENKFAFASEIKSLLALQSISREIDRDSLGYYLALQYTPPSRSIYSDIHKLPAGHSLTLDLIHRKEVLRRYWSPPVAPPIASPPENLTSELRYRLEAAVCSWAISDVPIGISLSGGIDSSAIVGLLASQGYRLKTWTLGFEADNIGGVDLDERRLAHQVAERWGTEHHEIVLKPDTLLADLGAMVAQLDEPYAGGLPSWYVFREMSGSVKVALTGSGGDELFGNYGKWRHMQPPLVPWAARLSRAIAIHGPLQYFQNPHGALYKVQFGEKEQRRMMKDGHIAEVPEMLERLWIDSGTPDPRQAIAYVDIQTQLPEEFLMMTDRFSMAWSVEARTPFLDLRLADFVLSLPSKERSPNGSLKGLLISAVRDLLPTDLLLAKKRGFVLPTADWLRGRLRPLLDHFLGREFLQKQGLFRTDLHGHLVRPHHAGKGGRLTEQLWTLLMFQLWWEHSQNSRL